MFTLLDKMFIKRFCLPSNSDVLEYEIGHRNVSECLCGHYNHVACVFSKGNGSLKKVNVLSYGVNTYADVDGKYPGVHAEQDALSKLMPLKQKKKLELIDMLVIRISKTNKLQNSKPCAHCIKMMSVSPVNKGYKIRNIYYSDADGNIIRTTLRTLELEEHHVSRFYKIRTKGE